MYVLDLFSGIGGFSLGLERSGMQTVAFCEIDPFCRAVLAKHWPDVPIFGDIGELEGGQFSGAIDVVCGGFPCQPFSVAGKRRGKDDDRALWPEMLRIIREVQPAWVIGENVPGIIPMELDGCLSDLETSGYACQTFVVPACAVDAPHRRDRVWVIGYTNSDEQSSQRKISGRKNAESSGVRSDAHPNSQGEPDGTQHEQRLVADSPSVGMEGNRTARQQVPSTPTRPEIPRCDGTGIDSTIWLAEPDVGRVADGIPHRVDRLRSLGNAVVPQVVERIGRILMESDE